MLYWARLIICTNIAKVAVCCLMLNMAGCAHDGSILGSSPAHHADAVPIEVPITLNDLQASFEEKVQAKIELDKARADIANVQNERDAAAKRADDANNAKIALDAKQAAIERNLLYGMGGMGILGVIGGVCAFIWLGPKLGMGISISGVCLLIIALVLRKILGILAWFAGGVLAIALLTLAGWAIGQLWIYWRTNVEASHLRVLANASDEPHAMILNAKATVLESIGAKPSRRKAA